MSHEPTVRAAALTGFGRLCRSYGAEGGPILRSVRLPARIEDEPDRRVPAAAVNRALERAAEALGVEDFGLRLAELRGFSNLGPVTVLARDEPDMRSALDVFMAYLPLHNEALDVRLTLADDAAILACGIVAPGRKTQATDVAVAMLHRILSQLVGAAWAPRAVYLERPAPRDDGQFRRTFGRRVLFGQEFSGIVFDPADLNAPNRLADTALRPYLAALRRELDLQAHEPMARRVSRLARPMLASRRCTASDVAAQLGLSRRTLDRRLAAEGASFLQVLDAVRRDLAQGQVERSARPMSDIAGLIGFSSVPAFTTWFTRTFGAPPATWRRRTQDRTARDGGAQ